jgi:hypothetical protein
MERNDMEKSVIMEMIMDMMENVHLSVRKKQILISIVEMEYQRMEKNVIYECRMEMECVEKIVGNQR